MDEKQVLELLKNKLSIRIESHRENYIGDGYKVSLLLDGEEISSDTIITNYD